MTESREIEGIKNQWRKAMIAREDAIKRVNYFEQMLIDARRKEDMKSLEDDEP